MNCLLPKKGVCTEDVCVHVLYRLTFKIGIPFHLLCVMNIFIQTWENSVLANLDSRHVQFHFCE